MKRNLHLCQSYQTSVELQVLASQHLNVISPKESSPIVTPIQDTVIGLYLLTQDTTKIVDYQFYNLLTHNDYFSGNIKHRYFKQDQPGFYSGKQAFTSFIPRNLNITFGSGDELVKIINGQLIEGVINKKSYTAKSFGIIHNVFEQNGAHASRNFLTTGQKIICEWLQQRGFSVGIRDLYIEDSVKENIQKAIEEDATKIRDMIDQIHMGTFENKSTRSTKQFFELQAISVLNGTRNTAFKLIKESVKDKNNRILDMIVSGAKGKPDNVSQMLGLLGQQTVDNGRIKDGYLHRSFPHFQKYDIEPESRGFIKSSFLEGLTPIEYISHCFSGREGIIDTAVKSVIGSTEIIIVENNVSKRVQIGKWIDQLLEVNKNQIKYYPENKNMEYLDLDSTVFIPSGDKHGNVKWHELTAITRHDPSEKLYEVKTLSGKCVTAAESETLLIWDSSINEFKPINSNELEVGQFVPSLIQMPTLEFKQEITVNEYFNPCDFKYSGNEGQVKDVFFDRIEEINVIENHSHQKLYDVTVPETLNFVLANGLNIRDTSSSGYLQRQIMKALEDCRVDYQYAVRKANGQIVQYLSGAYGFEPAKLEVHNINYAKWSLAKLNTIFYYDSKILKDILKPEIYKEYDQVKLDEHFDQILVDREYVITNVFANKQTTSISFGVNIERVITQVKNYYAKFNAVGAIDITPSHILKRIDELINEPLNGRYTKKVPLWAILIRYYLSPKRVIIEYNLPKRAFDQVVERIKQVFYESLVHPNQNIGSISGQSLGEVLTQMTLNCVSWDTEILISVDGQYKKVKIGQFIDTYMEQYIDMLEEHQNEDAEPTELLKIEQLNILIPQVNKNGTICWKQIKNMTRHPVVNSDGSDTILKITTESGRIVKATKGKSLVVRRNNEIVPIRGDQLTIDDYLPLTKKLEKINEIQTLDISHLFPKDQYLYSDEVQKALNIRDNPNSKRTWYYDNQGENFTLPYSRSDAFNERFTKVGGRRYTNFNDTYQQGCIYTHVRLNNGHFPVNIPLDYDFGYFIGAYLADGCLTDNHVIVSKNDPTYFTPIERWCDKYGIGYWYPITYNDNPNWQDGGNIRLCSYFTVKIIEHYCGKLSHNKFIHPTLLQAPYEFRKGLIEAYIGGDGTITDGYDVSVSSVSQKLLDDISIILSMNNINTHYSYSKPSLNTIQKFKVVHDITTLHIQGNNFQKFALTYTLPLQHKQEKLQIRYNKSINGGDCKSSKFNTIPGNTFQDQTNVNVSRQQIDYLPENIKNQINNEQVVYDKIKSIETYKDEDHKLVYDFTVDGTFMLYNGICVKNSFHSAGLASAKTSTSGVPLLKELLTVTQNIKTPENIIYLPSSKRGEQFQQYAIDIKNYIENKYLKDILISSEIIYDDPSDPNDYSVIEKDNSHIKEFKKYELYNNDLKKGFVLRLELDRQAMYDNDITMLDINAKLKMAYGSRINTIYNDDNDDILFFRIQLTEDIQDIVSHLKGLEYNIVNTISIKGIEGIKKAFYSKHKSPEKIYNPLTKNFEEFEEYVIETDGSNLKQVLQLPNIDKTRTISNNIREVQEIFGIEMARSLLEHSIDMAYKGANAGMSIQHISLLVDMMTHKGHIVQIDRHGINKQDIGPLAKCAFEEVNQVITQSTIFGEQEKFKGVMSNIMVGQIPSNYGTGAGTIVMDMEEYIRLAEKPLSMSELKAK